MSERDTARSPTISVGMPVFNGEAYLEAAINSVLKQSFGDFELIVSDNASSDSTPEICRDLRATDDRIRYFRNEVNVGAARNYERVFSLGTGEYFRWMNADDLCAPNLHERCLAALKDTEDAVLAFGNTTLIDASGEVIDVYEDGLDLRQAHARERFRSLMERVGLTNAIYGLIRRKDLASTQLMGNGTFPAADTNLMAELTLYGKFIELSEPLFFRRIHEQASSASRSDEEVQSTFWIGSKGAFRFPTWKRYFALQSAVGNSPLTMSERLSIQGHLARRMLWARGELWQDIHTEVRRLFAPRLQRGKL